MKNFKIEKIEDSKYITFEITSNKSGLQKQIGDYFYLSFYEIFVALAILLLILFSGVYEIMLNYMSEDVFLLLLILVSSFSVMVRYNYRHKGMPIKFWTAKLRKKNIIFEQDNNKKIIKIEK